MTTNMIIKFTPVGAVMTFGNKAGVLVLGLAVFVFYYYYLFT